MKLRALCLIVLGIVIVAPCQSRAAQGESLGDKIKRLFAKPSPTPRKHKKKTTAKTSPTPTPTLTPTPTVTPTPASTELASVSPIPTVTPSPTSGTTPADSPTVTATEHSPTPFMNRSRPHQAMSIEPVRAISPGPRRHRSQPPPEGVSIPSKSPGLFGTPAPERSPIAEAPASPGPASSVSATATPLPTASPEPSTKKAPVSAVSSNEISGYNDSPASVRKVLDLGLNLTNQTLRYKYGSANPANGGMDCSGFVHYVLAKNGIKNPPRDAREQYVWVRKAGNFQSVLMRRDDSFELDALKPGDLLFWASSTNIDRDATITQTMIYLGRDKATNQRFMIGASESQNVKGGKRRGVGVFDFKVSQPRSKSSEDQPGLVFIGYGRIPDLPSE